MSPIAKIQHSRERSEHLIKGEREDNMSKIAYAQSAHLIKDRTFYRTTMQGGERAKKKTYKTLLYRP